MEESIEAPVAVVREATGGEWPLKESILGWRAALQRIEPFVDDPELATVLRRAIHATDEFAGLYC